MRPLLALAILLAGASACSTPPARRPVEPGPAPAPTRPGPTAGEDTTARPAAPGRLTLEQALAFAGQEHPRIQAALAAVDQARARADGSGRLPDPELVARMESAPFDEGSTTGDAEYLLGLSQPLPLGDRRSSERDVALAEQERASRQLAVVARALDREVRGAFGTALYAQRVVEVHRELLDASRRQRELVAARLASGDALPADLARIELTEVGDAVELQRAEVLQEQALLALEVALASETPPATVDGELGVVFELPELAELLEQLDGNPALLAAEADRRVAAARVALAEELRAPDLRLDLLYRRIGETDVDALDVGLAVPLRLFTDGSARVREEQARLSRAAARARSARLDLAAALRDAHVRARAALQRVAFIETEVLPRAERLLDLTEARHAAGDVSLEEVLAARRPWLEVRARHLETLHEAMSAWADLSTFLAE